MPSWIEFESVFLENVAFYIFKAPLDPRLESIEWRSVEHTYFYLKKCLLPFSVEIGLCRGSGKDFPKVVNVFCSYLFLLKV